MKSTNPPPLRVTSHVASGLSTIQALAMILMAGACVSALGLFGGAIGASIDQRVRANSQVGRASKEPKPIDAESGRWRSEPATLASSAQAGAARFFARVAELSELPEQAAALEGRLDGLIAERNRLSRGLERARQAPVETRESVELARLEENLEAVGRRIEALLRLPETEDETFARLTRASLTAHREEMTPTTNHRPGASLVTWLYSADRKAREEGLLFPDEREAQAARVESPRAHADSEATAETPNWTVHDGSPRAWEDLEPALRERAQPFRESVERYLADLDLEVSYESHGGDRPHLDFDYLPNGLSSTWRLLVRVPESARARVAHSMNWGAVRDGLKQADQALRAADLTPEQRARIERIVFMPKDGDRDPSTLGWHDPDTMISVNEFKESWHTVERANLGLKVSPNDDPDFVHFVDQAVAQLIEAARSGSGFAKRVHVYPDGEVLLYRTLD